jgi:hypothetical protein
MPPPWRGGDRGLRGAHRRPARHSRPSHRNASPRFAIGTAGKRRPHPRRRRHRRLTVGEQIESKRAEQGSQRVAVAGLAWVEGYHGSRRGQIPATDLLRASVGISPEVARFYANSEDVDVYHSVGQKPRVCRDSYPRSEGPCQGRIVGLTDSGGNGPRSRRVTSVPWHASLYDRATATSEPERHRRNRAWI